MLYKTSEIYGVLLRFETQDPQKYKPKPHEKTLYDILEEKELISLRGGRLMPKGESILQQTRSLINKYGKNNVEIIPENAPGYGNYSFKVSLKPNAKERTNVEPKQENKVKETEPTVPKYSEAKTSIEDFARKLKEEYPVRDWSFRDCDLNLKTGLPFRRTMTEINQLKKFAEEAGVDFRHENQTPVYNLGNVTIIAKMIDSKNKRIPSKKEENLEITMMPGTSTDNETSKKLVINFLKNFKPYKPK